MPSNQASQADKAERFRALHAAPQTFLIPNPWDAGSARILESLGFKALATTSAGFAYTLGRNDGHISRAESLANAAAICAATDLPVSADLENLFADTPEAAALTIPMAAAAGLVGCSIEDATGNPADPIYPFELAVARVAAAVVAARALPFPFTLTARAENFLHGRPDLADSIARLKAFADVGADVVYAPGPSDLADIATIVNSVSKPVNVLVAPGMTHLTVADLNRLGVRRISVGAGLARAALGGLLAAAEEIQAHGTFTYGKATFPPARLHPIFAKDRS